MSNDSEIDQLKLKIFELETHVLACNVRLKAFQDYCNQVWEAQGMQGALSQPLLRDLERRVAFETLREYADIDPNFVSVLKTSFDNIFELDKLNNQ